MTAWVDLSRAVLVGVILVLSCCAFWSGNIDRGYFRFPLLLLLAGGAGVLLALLHG